MTFDNLLYHPISSYDSKLIYLESVTRRCSEKKVFLKISQKFSGKHLCQILFFNKVAGLSLNFIKKKGF